MYCVNGVQLKNNLSSNLHYLNNLREIKTRLKAGGSLEKLGFADYRNDD